MKFHTAPHKQALRKRVDRFFNSSTSCRKEVYEFVDLLVKGTDLNVYAFGGLVRDIGLFSVREFSSDVDLVVDGQREELLRALSQLPKSIVSENKFGGFRIRQRLWDIDIWCAEDTWAIKNRLVPYDDITSLLNTTFLSWDSALFDVRNKKIICKDSYFNDLINGQIDIVLKETPNELGAMVRLTRAIYSKGAKQIRRGAIEALKSYFEQYSYETIINYEKKSYSKQFLSNANLKRLHSNIAIVSNNVHLVDVDTRADTLEDAQLCLYKDLSIKRSEKEYINKNYFISHELLHKLQSQSHSKLTKTSKETDKLDSLNQLSFKFIE